MPFVLSRRRLLQTLCAAVVAPQGARAAAPATPVLASGPFDYAALKGAARALAAKDYVPPAHTLPPMLAALDYDHYQRIHYLPEHGLWHGEGRGVELRFFHPGFLFREPVQLAEIVDGEARPIVYDPARFDLTQAGVDGSKLPPSLGYAGFRVVDRTNPEIDIAAFLGASYFRAVGADKQYGLSARGLAIDTGMEHPEEFPRYTHFWFERPAPGATSLAIYALLDSPSVSGAYRIELTPAARLMMDIDVALYPRKPIARLGIAPLTSMYQTGENDRRVATDFRPEIHDSDGLAMWTGSGQWIWRPLENPRALRFNHYADRNPRGFGLLQRDRDFDHYQDDGVFYDRRPSVWVEPKSEWGEGGVVLVELSTADETFDNIVAFWQPKDTPQAGQELLYAYRLHWGRDTPVAPSLAIVVATRTGLGGVVGRKREYFSWRFAIDFAGGRLPLLPRDAKLELVATTSRGRLEIPSARPLEAIKGYRAIFDLVPDDSLEPINLTAALAVDGTPLTETWFYQYSPPPLDERRF
ncbi:MAG TPA: glucan biosynthesis protein D [Gammaproteobacteria bacterium]|nr:glucan biosynthesis protein D [Gammaproteobacteria bacterium]